MKTTFTNISASDISRNNKRSIVESIGSHLGYDYVVLFTIEGYRCGYVKFRDGEFEEDVLRSISCHDGITYLNDHLPNDHYVDDDNGFVWVGFDCGHRRDRPCCDELLVYFPEIIIEDPTALEIVRHKETSGESRSYRSLDFCINECKSIIEQLLQSKKG